MTKQKAKISLETLEHVARTARLDLTNEEKKKLQHDLSDILSAFRDLDKARPKCAPSFQPMEIKDVFRDDTEERCLTQEKALTNTKHKEKGFFKGPKAV
jgi:aspartyl-tRNA(Asn)/glutamyl-tRNA(Gln) amidotransferase subunit C